MNSLLHRPRPSSSNTNGESPAPRDGRRSTRSRWLHRLRVGLIIVAALLISLTAIGASYQAIAGAVDSARYPAPGQLVDVGGYRLHLNCTGSGSPTVILEAGGGEVSVSWHGVQTSVATFTRVCSYDRAGLGWSDTGPQPRTSQQMIIELHTLLARAHVPGPYVLVAHSFGGLNAQLFASEYPRDVAGLVLVESESGDIFERMPDFGSFIDNQVAQLGVQRALAPVGLLRLYIESDGPALSFDAYPASDRPTLRALAEQTRYLTTVYDEERYMRESAHEVQATQQSQQSQHTLGALPLVVITRGKYAPGDNQEAWESLQDALTRLSTNSQHVVAAQSGHAVMLDQPDVVVTAIQNIAAASGAH